MWGRDEAVVISFFIGFLGDADDEEDDADDEEDDADDEEDDADDEEDDADDEEDDDGNWQGCVWISDPFDGIGRAW